MASWISRALSRIGEQPSAKVATPLPPAELRAAVESAKKKMLVEGDVQGGRDLLGELLASNPDDADALAYYGAASFQVGVAEEARVALRRAVQVDPDHLIAHKYLAQACNALGDSDGMEIAAKNALRLAPRDLGALITYGIVCMNRLDIDAAAEAFSRAVEIAPTN